MSFLGCFSPLSQWIKSSFRRRGKNADRIIEIGPPTNFRKEEITMPFLDDDQRTLHQHDSHGVMTEKEAAQNAAVVPKTSAKDQLKKRVLRLGTKLTT